MNKCAHCGSLNTQAGIHEYQCLACGESTRFDGARVAPSPIFLGKGS